MGPPSSSSVSAPLFSVTFVELLAAAAVLLMLAVGGFVVLAMIRRHGLHSIAEEVADSLSLVGSDARRLAVNLCSAIRERVEAVKPVLTSTLQQAARRVRSWKRTPSPPTTERLSVPLTDKNPGFAGALFETAVSATPCAPVVARFTTRPRHEFVFSVDTAHGAGPRRRGGRASSATKAGAVHLRCPGCRKHYRVQGDIGERQLPCPECGSALDPLDGALRTMVSTISDAIPIVSVVCRHCSAIIDAPTAAVDTMIPCPRCQAELMVKTARQPVGR